MLKEPYAALYEGIVKKLKKQEHSKLLMEIFQVISEASDTHEATTLIKDALFKKIDQILGVM